MNQNKDDILLTVWCETYNFKDYIHDTMNGFLIQRTDFKFQVYIYDDASTDGTAEIIKKYMDEYPDLIKGYLSPVNTYRKPERHTLIKRLKEENVQGKYYALIEGDDYWTDPNKLQKQVGFLEHHPECSLTVHASRWIDYSKGTEYEYHPYHETRYLTDEEVILQSGGNFSTASYVYRINDLDMDPIFKLNDVGDIPLQLYELTKGRIYYFDEVMSAYRYMHKGSWGEEFAKNKAYEIRHAFIMREFYKKFNEYTAGRYFDLVQRKATYYLMDGALRDEKVSLTDYFCMLDNDSLITDADRERYYCDRKRVGQVYRGEYLLNDIEIQKLIGVKYIVIYGCGQLSVYVKKILELNNITLLGYIVSDDQIAIDKNNYPVWNISDYPYSKEETCVFTGISQRMEKIISENLLNNGMENVINLLWFKERVLT